MSLEETTQYKIAKATMADYLIEELQTNYNNITRFEEIIKPTLQATRHITSNLRISENFEENINNFTNNLNKYIPQFENLPDGSNLFLESVQSIMTNTFEYFPENSNIFDMLGANTLEDIQSLTQLDSTFIESVSNNLFSGTFQNILTDFDLDEFRLGSIFSIVEHNLGIFDIPNSLSNIIDISDNLLTNFSDVANLEFVSGILTNIPNTFSNLFLDRLGNLDIGGILGSFGLPDVAGILGNVLDVNGLMSGVIGQLTGQLSGILGGIGGGICGCIVGIGLGNFGGFLGNIVGGLGGQFSGLISGTLNSTVGNLLNGTPIGSFLDIGELTGAMTSQLDFLTDVSLPWSDAPLNIGGIGETVINEII